MLQLHIRHGPPPPLPDRGEMHREGKTEEKEGGTMADKFPERLKKMRERNRLKQCVLAELCGLSKNQIKKYESGKAEPRASSLESIADYFDVSIDYLVGRSDNPTKL